MKYLFLFLSFVVFSCCQSDRNGQSKLTADAFESMLKKDSTIQLLDVRTPEEFQEGHLAHAQNMNVEDANFGDKISQLDKNRPVMVYCLKGSRSANAADQLSTIGFLKVYDLQGGIAAWNKAGKSVVK